MNNSNLTRSFNFSLTSRSFISMTFSAYVLILSLSWMLLNYSGDGHNPYNGSGPRWFLLTIPLLLFVSLNLILFFKRPIIKIDLISGSLIAYVFFGIMVSIALSDIPRIFDVASFAVPLLFIYHFRTYITLRMINFIFFLALFVVILSYDSNSIYGFLPGQTTMNLHNGLWWRISIWKYITPPYSAAFCLIVLVLNLTFSRSKFRFAIALICIYFIVLSASRTSYIILLSLFTVYLLTRKFELKSSFIFYFAPVFFAALLFILQFLSEAVALLNIDNEFFKSAILRSTEQYEGKMSLSSRLLIIAEHFRLMSVDSAFGIFGIGSGVSNSLAWTANGGSLGGSTDSFITHILARDGLLVIFLIVAFAKFFVISCRASCVVAYLTLVSLLMYSVAYGAWLNFMSPVFLIYIGTIMFGLYGEQLDRASFRSSTFGKS